jgi:hypothetical protein
MKTPTRGEVIDYEYQPTGNGWRAIPGKHTLYVFPGHPLVKISPHKIA